MAYYDTPMSELEAVNIILRGCGFTPVASLVGMDDDGDIAYGTLKDVNRSVQAKGWYFNTELIKLTADGSGYFNLDDDVVKADTSYKDANVHATMRYDTNSKMFDLEDNTFVWTKTTLWVTAIKLLQWEDIPYHAKEYITALAALQTQEALVGAPQLDGYLGRTVQAAWAELNRAENNNSDPNMLTGSWSVARGLQRRHFNRGGFR